MTGEQFHDVLTLLPEDLIARADEVRSRKPKTLHWRRYVSLAACCALLVLCGILYQNQPVKTASNEMTKVFSAADSPAEMAPAPASGDLGAMDAEIAAPQCLEIPDLPNRAEDAAFPTVSLFDNREALEEGLSEMGESWDISGLEMACEGFDDSFFHSQDLLLIFSQDVTGVCEVQDIAWTQNGCTVKIAVHPGGREDTTNYAALIPTQKGEIFPGNVAVVYMTDTNP